jgi:hypothetical protein
MYPPTRTPRRRTARTLLVVVLVGLALVAGVVLWQAESPGTVQPGASPTDRSAPQDPAGTGYLAPAVPAADPVASAVAWLQATRSLSFADGARRAGLHGPGRSSPTDWQLATTGSATAARALTGPISSARGA